ncbi:uncharacterized protein AB675_11997 [Cyphellophora attinorum]|uniref:Uncharacterized protein n=1 Tax=Cyphellophora attinorum TaxID=1664694 RepID=A0A0N0NKR3_9EURO|nr:uncharacterized protein AB675_11997 [Phialophora attinorum]KPI38451.1 hypothetical protein AB675_11997 [Phialophora attinorum]
MAFQPRAPESCLAPKTADHEAFLKTLQAALDEAIQKRQRIEIDLGTSADKANLAEKAKYYEQRIEKLKDWMSFGPKTADLADVKQEGAADRMARAIEITDLRQKLAAEKEANQAIVYRSERHRLEVSMLRDTLQVKTAEGERHQENARLLENASQDMHTKIQEQQAELQHQKDEIEAQKAQLAEAGKQAWEWECKYREVVRPEEEARYMENAPQYTRGNIQPLQAELQRQKDELKAQKAQLAAANKLAWQMECKYREAADALSSEREHAKVNYNVLWTKIRGLEVENHKVTEKASTTEKSLSAKATSFEVAVIKASGKAEDLGRELEEVKQAKNLEINALKNLERDLTDEIRTLVHEKEESDLIRSELTTKVAMLEPELAKCRFRVDSLEREKGAVNVASNFMESQLEVKHEKEESERTKSEVAQKVTDLEDQVTLLKDVEVESIRRFEDAERLRNKLRDTKLELEASHRKETELAQKVSELVPQIADLEHIRVQLIETHERERKDSSNFSSSMGRRIANLEHQLRVSNGNNAKLAARVRELGSLLIDVQGELDTTKQQREALQGDVLELDTLRTHMNDCETKFQNMQAEKAQLSNKLDDLVRQLNNTRQQNDADVAALQDRERTLAMKLTALIAEKEQRERVGADLAVQITKLSQQLTAQQKKNASLLDGHAKEKKALERSIDKRTTEINDLMASNCKEIAELKQSGRDLRESISSLEKKNAMLVERLMTGGRQSAARIGELLDVLRLREKEAETLRDELDQKKKDVENMLTDMDWLAEEGGYKSDKIKSLEKENLELHEKISILKDDWVESEDEFAESKKVEEN